MAHLRPFAALLPKPELAARICELPYDVMSSDEARELAFGNPLSFLHVSKPEIDLPLETDLYSPAVYAQGRRNLDRLVDEGSLRRDDRECFYLYRQVMGKHVQVGLVAAASCQEYLDGTIVKHELTRVDKEEDRVRHIEALDSQTGPVFLTYRARVSWDEWVGKRTSEAPLVDFTAGDGVRHTSWRISDPEEVRHVEREFLEVPRLYIADGHHRSAAAARVFQARSGRGRSGTFLTVIFPHDQMQILPYNRVLKDLNGRSVEGLLEELARVFEVRLGGSPKPERKHAVSCHLAGRWYSLGFRPALVAGAAGIRGLDVSLLQEHVLAPIFGIDDPRTSKRIHFVGGIRGTAELERLISGGEHACAFSMFPTSIDDLMVIADAGGIMPPKSTWFEPKLRDAMFCHMLD